MLKAKLLGLLRRPEPDDPASKKALKPPQKRETRLGRYQSVSIANAGKCCAAVKSLAGRRFLAGDAPSLPLAACSLADQCKCRFQKHVDRRDYERRLPGEKGKWYGGAEQRRSRGRRQAD
jgi:hypothetical protein